MFIVISLLLVIIKSSKLDDNYYGNIVIVFVKVKKDNNMFYFLLLSFSIASELKIIGCQIEMKKYWTRNTLCQSFVLSTINYTTLWCVSDVCRISRVRWRSGMQGYKLVASLVSEVAISSGNNLQSRGPHWMRPTATARPFWDGKDAEGKRIWRKRENMKRW